MRPVHRAPRPLGRRTRPLGPLLAPLLALAAFLPVAAPVAAAEPDFPPSMRDYHNWPELQAELAQAAADHPDLVSLVSIGKSWQGRPIWMAKVSDNPAQDEDEPEVLVDALHHAREHLTTEQALALLHWLTDDYAKDATVKALVDSREVYIIFALNPDGLRFDLTGDPFRAWRKNRQRDSAGLAMFTDLNRNYDYRWACCGGSSGNRRSITYRGPFPFSAPEARAMRDFVNSRVVGGVQQIRAHVTLHTNGELILWPYGYTTRNVPSDMTRLDRRTFVSLGRAMAARNGYHAQQSSDLYVTDGDQIDWMYGRHRIFSFTYELYPPETTTVWGDHYPDDSVIAAQTARNRSALLLLIERAACPYATLGADATRANCGPLYDDLEIGRGWARNPAGTDTATAGAWSIADPAPTSTRHGTMQLGTTVSGSKALVTGAAAGASAAANDVDGGSTTVRSRVIPLPEDPAALGALTFSWTIAHGPNASADDALRVLVETEDGTRTTVFEVLGRPTTVNGAWRAASVNIDAWAGQRIRLVLEAVDGGRDNILEAAVDDIRIRQP